MSELRKVGDVLHINLQLYDGDKSLPKRVFVEMSRADGILLEPKFEIPHVINGDFRDDTRVMPDLDIVTTQFFVYEADGVTEDQDYIINKDIYLKDITGTIVVENLDAKVSSISAGSGNNNNALEVSGEVAEIETLDGSVEDTEVSGSVEEIESISGEVCDGC